MTSSEEPASGHRRRHLEFMMQLAVGICAAYLSPIEQCCDALMGVYKARGNNTMLPTLRPLCEASNVWRTSSEAPAYEHRRNRLELMLQLAI